MANVIVGIDVGTTKVCTLIGRQEADGLHILGVGIAPSRGMRKGAVIDLEKTTEAIRRSVAEAESTSGMTVSAAYVSLAGEHVFSLNSRGMVNVQGGVVDEYDIVRVLEQARMVAVPPDKKVVHVIQRSYRLDEQEGIRDPRGMYGNRLEAETHIVAASQTMMNNLEQCVNSAGVQVVDFVLNPLASGEVILTDDDRQMGVAVCDIGGGTTDVAIYVDGDAWHTMVLPVGGNHVTNDIAVGLRLPPTQAETLKIRHGHALQREVPPEEMITLRPFGETQDVQINRLEMAYIIEARMEELFALILREIKRSGYDGLLPAGLVLTGGASQLPGTVRLAREVLGMPVRLAAPEGLHGMTDRLDNPAYSTSVGLLHWANAMHARPLSGGRAGLPQRGEVVDRLRDFFKRLLP